MAKTTSKPINSDVTLTAAQCAKRTGLTVKALRVYERQGLLSPRRTLKDWRIYDASDLARLGEVMALRALGLKLADIRKLLKGKPGDIGRMLELQQEDLLLRRQQLDLGLTRVTQLRTKLATGETLTINDVATSIKESRMSANATETMAWKRYEQMRPRVATHLERDVLQAYCGEYLLSGLPMRVFLAGDRLMAQIEGQPALQLHPESKDSFFYAEVPAQITFARAAGGEAQSLVLHQHGIEQEAPRISSIEADSIAEALRARAASGQPDPRSLALVEAMLDSQAAGTPDFAIMAPALALIVGEQNAVLTGQLQELGRRTSIRFNAVTPEGWDSYRVVFENGEMDVSVSLDADGKISGAFMEPPRAASFWSSLRNRKR